MDTSYDTPYHAPIMVREVLQGLALTPGARVIDGTLGGGGHTHAILDAIAPDGVVLALDRDPQAFEAARARLGDAASRVIFVQSNYAQAADLAITHLGRKADALLIDAGVSSHQLDDPSRGFSFREGGPLDMRMGPDTSSLAQWLAEVDHVTLTATLRDLGEVPMPHKIAAAILRAREANKLDTTADLRDAVLAAGVHMGRHSTMNPATLVFQGLRIAVNDELTHLATAVARAPDAVRPGGRVAFIAFHSLEDRIVKQGMRSLADPCSCPKGLPMCACGATPRLQILTRQPIKPSAQEVAQNSRSRSAVLRVAQILS